MFKHRMEIVHNLLTMAMALMIGSMAKDSQLGDYLEVY